MTGIGSIAAAPWHAPVRRERIGRKQLAVGLLVLASVVPMLLLRSDPASDSAASRGLDERQALAAYIAQIHPLAQQGGRVVQLGLKAGVTDIGQARFTDSELITMATGWVAELERVREGFAAASAPPFASDARATYDEALDGYVAAAKTLLDAARARGEQRTQLVALAVSLGERTDAVYDRAGALLERHRARLGLADAATKKED